jgi:hypothetical protein
VRVSSLWPWLGDFEQSASGIIIMRSSHSLRLAVAAMLVSHAAFAQESKPEEVVVTSTALRESPLEVAQPFPTVPATPRAGRSVHR